MANPFTIRKYRPEDRDALRHICCETGFLGDPVDPLFEDRDLFADFLTGYYLDYEPESTWVAEAESGPIGYLMGCRRYAYHDFMNTWLTARVTVLAMLRLMRGKYRPHSRAFIKWVLTRGWREIPKVPPRSAHLHFNLLPEWRHKGVTLRLLHPFLEYLKENGAERCCGQMVLPPDRRPPRVFERYGWKVYDTVVVSKYAPFREGEFVLATLTKEFGGEV